jgi:hypothetical protein
MSAVPSLIAPMAAVCGVIVSIVGAFTVLMMDGEKSQPVKSLRVNQASSIGAMSKLTSQAEEASGTGGANAEADDDAALAQAQAKAKAKETEEAQAKAKAKEASGQVAVQGQAGAKPGAVDGDPTTPTQAGQAGQAGQVGQVGQVGQAGAKETPKRNPWPDAMDEKNIRPGVQALRHMVVLAPPTAQKGGGASPVDSGDQLTDIMSMGARLVAESKQKFGIV